MRGAAGVMALVAVLVLAGCPGPGEEGSPGGDRAERSLDPLYEAGRGGAIAYHGFRDGQLPGEGPWPTQEQVEEDLHLLARNWRLIRIYSADRHGEDVLEVIRREQLDLRVMLGIWLDREPGAEGENAESIAAGIRLANAYDDIVVAVNVGNEALIEWTEHPVEEESVTRYLRQVRGAVSQPVTVADNYVWWRDHGAALAREVDFITIHSYPLWERKTIDEGLSYTVANYEQVRAAHPERVIAIGEAGWATYTEGNLHVARGGDERSQQRYYEALTGWARANDVTVFWFEAFDEPWKGTGTEGHWGLFTVDRKAKPVMQALFPDRMPDGPTSPDYSDRPVDAGPELSVALRADFAAAVHGGNVNPLGPGVASSGVESIEGAEGGTALVLDFSGEGWGGVYFFLGKYDAKAAASVRMQLRLPDEVHRLELSLEGPETIRQSIDLIEHDDGREVDGWRSFSVPLSRFDQIDLSRVTVVGLWNPSDRAENFLPCELVVDDMRFE